MSQVQGDRTIVNDFGLHARAASKLVALANKYACDVYVGRLEREVNAKSILGVLMLAAGKGATINVRCDGADADDAFSAISKLVDEGFGEL